MYFFYFFDIFFQDDKFRGTFIFRILILILILL